MWMHGTTRSSARHLIVSVSNVHLSKTRLKKLPNSLRTSPFLLTPAAYTPQRTRCFLMQSISNCSIGMHIGTC